MTAKYQGKHVASNANANTPRFDEPEEPLFDEQPYDEPQFDDASLDETTLLSADGFANEPFDSPLDETTLLSADGFANEPFDSPLDETTLLPADDFEDASLDATEYVPVVGAGASRSADRKRPSRAQGDRSSSRDSRNAPKGKGGKKGKKGKRSALSTALLIIGFLLLAAAVALGIYISKDYINARVKYDDLRDVAGNLEVFDEIFNGDKDLFDIEIDWDTLKAKNPDIVGWIYVENTKINYPICQAKDNDYYLSHNADGNPSSSGAIFLDCDNELDMSSDINFIYGHNMMDGSMFANITKFKKQSFLDKNNRIIIVTPEHAWILGCAFTYIADGSEKIRKTDFDTPEEMRAYIHDLMDKRAVTSSLVDIDEIDKMFCLVTCSYERNDVRTVLCAVEQRAIDFPKS